MPAQRFKSHLGCTQCKKRKVKCDEGTPACSNCVRRREKCSLLETKLYLLRQQGLTDPFASTASSPAASIITHVIPSEPLPSLSAVGQGDDTQLRKQQSFSVLDLEMTHQFTTKSYRTIMLRPLLAEVWRDDVFRLSLKWPSLLGALLATAAMHKIVEDPSCDAKAAYVEYASEKQREMVSTMAKMIQQPSEENCAVLFISTIVLSVWAFAGRQLPSELNDTLLPSMVVDQDAALSTKRPVLSKFLGVVNIVQGVYGVSVGMYSWIHKQGFGILMAAPDWNNLPPVPEDIEHNLQDLEDEIRTYGESGADELHSTKIMLASINGLRSVYQTRQSAEWRDMVIGWSITLPKQIVTLLTKESPLALVILAHWTWVLHDLDDSWWLRGWAGDLYHEIRLNLPNRWARYLLVHSARSVK